MSTEETRSQLAAIEAEIVDIARVQPAAVMLAILDVLVDVASSGNPALRDFRRLQVLRAVIGKLSALSSTKG